jgi:hypothetical protein
MDTLKIEINRILAERLSKMLYNNITNVLEDSIIKKEAQEEYKEFKDMIEFHKSLCQYLSKMNQHINLIEHCNDIINRLPDNDYEDFM